MSAHRFNIVRWAGRVTLKAGNLSLAFHVRASQPRWKREAGTGIPARATQGQNFMSLGRSSTFNPNSRMESRMRFWLSPELRKAHDQPFRKV